tara:strand:+ start:43 stop:486 length:444 start_codon:yes stop_codon:yes gene_type:complete
MSKKLSYKGSIPMGEQDRIRLSTKDGKTGYKITKFQLIGTEPGVGNSEYVGQIYKTDQSSSISSGVDFTNSDLLAVSYVKEGSSPSEGYGNTIIMDNEKFNQNIFVNITDASGGTRPCNYYIELEAMPLSDLEATMLTLKNIRTITS